MIPELQPFHEAGIAQLNAAMESGDCIAILGAGPVSKQYGTWVELLYSLSQELEFTEIPEACFAMGTSQSEIDEVITQRRGIETFNKMLRKKINPDDLKYWAEGLMRKDKTKFCNFLYGWFSKSDQCPRIYKQILHSKFASFFTTNFDDMLCVAAADYGVGDRLRVMTNPDFDLTATNAIVHLHGRIKSPSDVERIVFTASQFTEAYPPASSEDESQLQRLLGIAFYRYHACFIGYRFSEPEIQNIYQSAIKAFKKNHSNPKAARRSFAFIDEDDWLVHQSLDEDDGAQKLSVKEHHDHFLRLGVTLIPYNKIDAGHSGLHKILENLPTHARPSPTPRPSWDPEKELPLGPPAPWQRHDKSKGPAKDLGQP